MTTLRLPKTLMCALILALPALPALASAAADPVAQHLAQEEQRVGVDTFTAHDYKKGTLQHVVLIRFRDGVSAAQRQQIAQQYMALQKQSLRNGKPYIVSIQAGPQFSGEGFSHGLQQAFITTFSSEGDRNYFIGTPVVTDPHHYEPTHAAFKEVFKPVLADGGLLSFDFPVIQTAP